MVSEDRRRHLLETARIRDQADDLLLRLLTERQHVEERLAEAGRRDPIKCITGRSSIENAIATTRDMIRNMDALLDEMSREVPEVDRMEISIGLAMGTVHAGAGR